MLNRLRDRIGARKEFGAPLLGTVLGRNERCITVARRTWGSARVGKYFNSSNESKAAIASERLAQQRFGGHAWKVPVRFTGDRAFVMPYLRESHRLDRLAPELGREERLGFAVDAMMILLDIHAARLQHRDLHAGNLYVAQDGALVACDFETLVPAIRDTPFKLSYDVTGVGPEEVVGKTCGAFEDAEPLALHKVLGIGAEEVLAATEQCLRVVAVHSRESEIRLSALIGSSAEHGSDGLR